jgi:hypothetical protein
MSFTDTCLPNSQCRIFDTASKLPHSHTFYPSPTKLLTHQHQCIFPPDGTLHLNQQLTFIMHTYASSLLLRHTRMCCAFWNTPPLAVCYFFAYSNQTKGTYNTSKAPICLLVTLLAWMSAEGQGDRGGNCCGEGARTFSRGHSDQISACASRPYAFHDKS